MSDGKNITSVIWATFVADSFSLGTQWIYDQEKIKKEIGRLDRLAPAPADSLHYPKKAGELCNYGDHIFNLLQFVGNTRSFDVEQYKEYWKQYFSSYTGYKDQASKRFAAGNTSSAHHPLADYGAAVRFTPLLLLAQEPESLFDLAWQEASMTHNSQICKDTLHCMVDALFYTREGDTPIDALSKASANYNALSTMVEMGTQFAGLEVNTVIQKIGAACGIDVCLPAVAFLLASYPNDLKELLIANSLAGGDVAARAMGAALLMVAHHGISSIPKQWIEGLQKRDEIAGIIDSYSV